MMFFALAADFILLLHFIFAVFITLGLLLIFGGKIFSWSWVRNPWFRVMHLAAIIVVVVQSWLGVVCIFTVWENALRKSAGGAVYNGTFMAYWLERILYYEAPEWVFAFCYTVFGLLVVASWYWVRPDPFSAFGKKGNS